MVAITHWTVSNHHTGKTSNYKSRRAASKAADKADNAYGAICCTVRAHWGAE